MFLYYRRVAKKVPPRRMASKLLEERLRWRLKYNQVATMGKAWVATGLTVGITCLCNSVVKKPGLRLK